MCVWSLVLLEEADAGQSVAPGDGCAHVVLLGEGRETLEHRYTRITTTTTVTLHSSRIGRILNQNNTRKPSVKSFQAGT